MNALRAESPGHDVSIKSMEKGRHSFAHQGVDLSGADLEARVFIGYAAGVALADGGDLDRELHQRVEGTAIFPLMMSSWMLRSRWWFSSPTRALFTSSYTIETPPSASP